MQRVSRCLLGSSELLLSDHQSQIWLIVLLTPTNYKYSSAQLVFLGSGTRMLLPLATSLLSVARIWSLLTLVYIMGVL